MFVEGLHERHCVQKGIDGPNAHYGNDVFSPALDEHRTEPIAILGIRNLLRSTDFKSSFVLSSLRILEHQSVGRDWLSH